jgi:GTPase SAR1 family protein
VPGRRTAVESAVANVAQIAQELESNAAAERLRAAVVRAARAATVVCVVGEFKQGKSSLVNALVGSSVCPVDDDLGTAAITLVRFGEQPIAVVRQRVGLTVSSETIPIERASEWVTEAGNPANERGVERVEISIPSALLKNGLVVVDTPGMGGLGAGQAAATLAFLPYADALLFVSDATSELSAPELDFLASARERCPVVVFTLTKIDIAPRWRKIADRDRAHLDKRNVAIQIVPMSPVLNEIGTAMDSAELVAASRVPQLTALIRELVIEPAKGRAAERAATEGKEVINQLLAGLATEQAVLDDPRAAEDSVARLADAKARLEHLRGAGSRWSTVLADSMSDLSNDANYELRSALRSISRDYESRTESLKTPAQWTEMGRSLAADVSAAVSRVFNLLDDGAIGAREKVAEVLREESLAVPSDHRPRHSQLDLSALWPTVRIADEGHVARRAFGGAISSLRGAQSGYAVLGLVGSFLPHAVGALVLSTPITLGLGVALAGNQLLDANKRKLALRRQKAKSGIRQFIDDVQFQVSNELAEQLRETQRELRDEFNSRVGELSQTLTETARRAQEDAARGASARADRGRRVVETIATLERLLAELDR